MKTVPPGDAPGTFRVTRTLVYEGTSKWIRETLDKRAVRGQYVVGPYGKVVETVLGDCVLVEQGTDEEWLALLTSLMQQAPISVLNEVLENFGANEPGDDA